MKLFLELETDFHEETHNSLCSLFAASAACQLSGLELC